MQDPFSTLGVPRAFTLDARSLQARFIAQSAENHPDRYTDPLDQADAADRASLINQAYRLLSDPMLRAQALLELLAPGPVPKEQATALPKGFLLQVMEVREGMDEARQAGDKARLRAVRAEAQAEFDQRLGTLGALLDKACQAPDAPILGQARLELNALRYLRRMLDEADTGLRA